MAKCKDRYAREWKLDVRPKYYEVDGALTANANRAWLLAFLTIPVASGCAGFAVFVRLQPPTVIRHRCERRSSGCRPTNKGWRIGGKVPGQMHFLDRAFVSGFLIATSTTRHQCR